jgi:hypothetical protein
MSVIAAVYARKSTDQLGLTDEQKSVTRQVEHARAYAVRKGWTVLDECVFVDDAVSGAEFATRPGFVRLMSVLKPHPAFQVLVMAEESRLGREQIEVAYDSVEHDLLRPEIVERAIELAIDELRPDGDTLDRRRAGILTEIRRLDGELSRLISAVASGGDLPALLAALKERQASRERCERALIELDSHVWSARSVTAWPTGERCCGARSPRRARSSGT